LEREGVPSRELRERAAELAFLPAMLLAAVVGSGIMGKRLSGGNVAIALLANTVATGAALVAPILTFGPISGAHFNPAVSFADASQGGLSWRDAWMYSIAQIVGALVGVAVADAMFAEPIYAWSHLARAGYPTAIMRVGRAEWDFVDKKRRRITRLENGKAGRRDQGRARAVGQNR
jgi:glycerol uptake facilitator-like aquaporin